MVKTYSQLYLDARKILMAVDDADTAGFTARQILCHVSGKTPEQVLAGRDLYASEEICAAMDFAVHRALSGEPLAYILGQ